MARDDFKTQTVGEYDPDRIYTRAADAQGHSFHLRAPIPKHWGGQIAAVVQDPRFGYRSNQDFARDAIYHRLHWAHEKRGDVKFLGRLGFDKMLDRLDHYQVEQDGYVQFEHRLQEAANVANMHGDKKEFARILDYLRDEAKLNLREPFLSKTLDKINTLWEVFAK